MAEATVISYGNALFLSSKQSIVILEFIKKIFKFFATLSLVRKYNIKTLLDGWVGHLKMKSKKGCDVGRVVYFKILLQIKR